MSPQTLAALGEPNRFRIVELLRTGPQPVSRIGARLRLRQSQVSQHLKVLKGAGIVAAEANAQQRLYELRPQPLRELHDWLDRYRVIWEERFEQLDNVIASMNRKQADRRIGQPRKVRNR
jgi:DNA-binding transcriptional ArsR family regulator